jgi:hypothetical protein
MKVKVMILIGEAACLRVLSTHSQRAMRTLTSKLALLMLLHSSAAATAPAASE